MFIFPSVFLLLCETEGKQGTTRQKYPQPDRLLSAVWELVRFVLLQFQTLTAVRGNGM